MPLKPVNSPGKPAGSQNLIEKIVQRYAVGLAEGQIVHAGDFVSIRPEHILTHDNTAAVMQKFRAIGATRMYNPRQPVFALDHNVQNTSPENLEKYARIEDFARELQVDFYPAGRGIGHQIMLEEGYAFPGNLSVASDSHANMYGGVGCLGTPVVRTDAAAIWATGRTWWQVPPVSRVIFSGTLQPGVTGKDVIITLCGLYHQDEVLNHVLEFTGPGVAGLSLDERLTIANMTTEWGALAGVFPVDEITLDWYRQRVDYVRKRGLEGVPSDKDGQGAHPRLNGDRIRALEKSPPEADPDAGYAGEIRLDLGSVTPHISGPDHVKVMAGVSDLKKHPVRIDKAYLVSCVNSRASDLAQAADIVRGHQVAAGVEFYIAAASREVQQESERRGDWQALLQAGAIPLPPGCGPCIGLGAGLLGDGETGISATNRNFKGRMGSRNARTYLASPAVVAASALKGRIAIPGTYSARRPVSSRNVPAKPGRKAGKIAVLKGFPAQLEGELLFCYQDNLNTDGIYPGKYTYIDDFGPDQQAGVVMENYDPGFQQIVRRGDILVGGFNFGTGSSREQAATALKYRGIPLVIAGSFSQTYKRNAFNNGFPVIESPELVRDLQARFGREQLTVRTGWTVSVDFTQAVIITEGGEYAFDPLGVAAQELVLEGGLEGWVKSRI